MADKSHDRVYGEREECIWVSSCRYLTGGRCRLPHTSYRTSLLRLQRALQSKSVCPACLNCVGGGETPSCHPRSRDATLRYTRLWRFWPYCTKWIEVLATTWTTWSAFPLNLLDVHRLSDLCDCATLQMSTLHKIYLITEQNHVDVHVKNKIKI